MRKVASLALMFCLSALAYGCGTPLYVMNYPGFFTDTSTYSSIAVEPVHTEVDRGRYTRELGRKLVSGYLNNGYYAVYNHTHGGNAMTDLDVYATIMDYGERHSERIDKRTEKKVYYKRDSRGNTIRDNHGNPIVDRVDEYEVKYKVFERKTYAEVSAIVVENATGNQLYNKTFSGSCHEEETNPRNFSPIGEARWCAIDDASSSIVYQTSPTFDRITVDSDDILKIYRNDAQEGWIEDDEFASDGTAVAHVWFPPAALYNTFYVEVIAKDTQASLAKDKIYWNGETFQFEYKIADLVSASGGQSEFKVRIWNGDRVALEKSIEVLAQE